MGSDPGSRLLSERARRIGGPQRLYSLDPDTEAAVPSSWRLRVATRRESYSPRAGPPVGLVATERCYAAGFRTAPVGTTPVVAYRHSAISSLRASATIPIRRARLPMPKRVRYQVVSALCG